MRKIILIIVIALLAMTLQSCGSYINLEKEQKAIAEKILECLDEDNAEELKGMFCERAIEETDNIDRQIERAMEFFEVIQNLMILIVELERLMSVIIKKGK